MEKEEGKAIITFQCHTFPTHSSQIMLQQHPSIFSSLSAVGWIVSHKKLCWSPSPQYLEMWPYLETVFADDQTKMKSYSYVQHDWHPHNRRDTWGEHSLSLKWWRQRLKWCMYKPRDAKDCWQFQQLRERHGTDSPLELSEKTWPCWHFISGLWPPEL